MKNYSVRSSLFVFIAAAICTKVVSWLNRRHSNAFGTTFDNAYMNASEIAEANWADIERLAVLDLNGPIKPEHLQQIMNLKANYLWYYSEHASRGVMLRWQAMSVPLWFRLLGHDASVGYLLRFHRKEHERLLKVRKDLCSAGVPRFFLRAPFRDLTPTHY